MIICLGIRPYDLVIYIYKNMCFNLHFSDIQIDACILNPAMDDREGGSSDTANSWHSV